MKFSLEKIRYPVKLTKDDSFDYYPKDSGNINSVLNSVKNRKGCVTSTLQVNQQSVDNDILLNNDDFKILEELERKKKRRHKSRETTNIIMY